MTSLRALCVLCALCASSFKTTALAQRPQRTQRIQRRKEFLICFFVLSCFAAASFASDQPQEIHFTIDATADVKPISRFIYGVNEPLGGPFTNLTLTRLGGNRWSAYNWLNNASNAGNDWHYQNDNYLGGGSAPGGAMIPGIENARQNHAGIILTVPMIGRLSADKNADGDPRTTPDYLQKRFRPEQPAKNSPFNLSPDPNSSVVYEDEFINWVKFHYPYGQTDPQTPIWFMLDNEPDLWAGTHAEVHPNKTTYAELIAKTIAYATAIKRVEPNAVIFGPANYGWNGFVTLQNAPDAAGRDFQTVYLQAMAAAEKQSGHRLLDVLDIHWYPSERIGKIRITSPDTTPDLDEARIQSPRSLWDPTYTESSWITRNLNAPIRLIPRLQEKIARNYPGTKLSISEYQYGGYDSISGALAQADALGTFGRQGLFAANQWPPGIPQPYTTAAFAMFRNFDAHRATFGNISIRADSENPSAASIYASLDSANPRIMILVAINKTLKPLSATAILTHAAPFTRMEIFQLTSADPHPHFVIEEKIPDPQNLRLSLPGRSVSTFRLSVGQ